MGVEGDQGCKGKARPLTGDQPNEEIGERDLGAWMGGCGTEAGAGTNSDTHEVLSGEVTSWSLHHGTNCPACLMGMVCMTWK